MLILFGITLISVGVLYKKLNYDLVENRQDDLIMFGILISVGSTMTLFGFGCLILIWINLIKSNCDYIVVNYVKRKFRE